MWCIRSKVGPRTCASGFQPHRPCVMGEMEVIQLKQNTGEPDGSRGQEAAGGPDMGKKPGLEAGPELLVHHPSLTLTLVSLFSSSTVCSVRLMASLNSVL